MPSYSVTIDATTVNIDSAVDQADAIGQARVSLGIRDGQVVSQQTATLLENISVVETAAAVRSTFVNAFSILKQKATQGRSASLMVWGDSTGNNNSGPREWPYLLADKLAQAFPSHKVLVYTWNDGSQDWTANSTAQVVQNQSSAAAPVLTIWNCSIPGVATHYALGSMFKASVGLPVDGLIINHGHNAITGTVIENQRGELLQAIEMYRELYPAIPISVIAQNPRQDSALMDSYVIGIRDIALLRNVGVIDVYSDFIAAGKPTYLYLSGDTTHPNQGGSAIYVKRVWEHYLSAVAGPVCPSQSLFDMPVNPDFNLLTNGHFRNFPVTPGLPTGWSSGGAGTLTCSKETTIAVDDIGYSVKLIATGNSAYITQSVAAGLLANLKGQPVTLAARRWVDASAASTVGRIQLLTTSAAQSNPFWSSRSYVTRQTGWVWWVLSGMIVPSDCSAMSVRLYHDTAASPSAVAAQFDQVCLVPGYLPRAAR